MNYIIENNIDFYTILNQEIPQHNGLDTSNCLITNTPLEENFITLACFHTFNYEALYREISMQKQYNYLEIVKLKDNQIKCPYCRKITKNILPYFSKYNLPHTRGVNYPEKYALKLYSCEYLFKYGKCKNNSCNKTACKSEYGICCNLHYNMAKKNSLNKKDNYNIYTVKQLKELLKLNACKVSGLKQCLIDRILIEKDKNPTLWKNL